MSLTSKWARITPGCYAEEMPVVNLWNIDWPKGVAVGVWDSASRGFLLFDGTGLKAPGKQPTHWRPLAAPPYVAKRVRVSREEWKEALWTAAKQKHERMVADRAAGMTWHELAPRHGYRTASAARESFKTREKFLSRDPRFNR